MSGSQERESDRIDKGKSSGKRAGKPDPGKNAPRDNAAAPREKGARKQRTADLGRALRSIYDDTLRESVPDDFMDLLGKLT